MNEWYWAFFEFIINVNNIGFTLYLAYALFAKKRQPFFKVATIIIGIFGVGWLSLYSFADFRFLSDIFPDIVVFILYSVLILRATKFMAVLWALINTLTIGVISLASMEIFSMLLGNSVTAFSSSGTNRFLLMILVQILRIFAVFALSKLFGKRSHLTLIKRNWIGIAFAPAFSVFLLFVLSKYSVLDTSNEVSAIFLSIIYSGIFILNMGILFFLFQLSSQAEKALEYQTYSKIKVVQHRHNDEMQKIYADMRIARHDFAGRIQTIQGLIQMKQYNELSDYMETFSDFFLSVTEFIDTGNKVVDALLSVKMGMAKAEGIQVEITAEIPSDCIVTDDHLCVVIGNMVDNAYDACLLIEDKLKRYICLSVQPENQNLCISCINSTGGREHRRGTKWQTSKSNPEQHGFGLMSIDRIVEDYGGFCAREHTDNQFISTIIIPLEIPVFM